MEFLLPKGVKILPPKLAEKREKVKEIVLTTFRRWGFRRVITPTFEYYDEVYMDLDRWLSGAIVKITERETGRIIILRPDFTPQVAKIASTIMRSYPRPLRLFYYGFVYRWPLDGSRRVEKETYQAGLELIGIGQPEAFSEMIAIAVEILDKLSIKNRKIVVSHLGFINCILESVEPSMRSKILLALRRKATDELLSFNTVLDQQKMKVIEEIPRLIGDESILNFVERKFSDYPVAPFLLELKEVYRFLREYGLGSDVVFDLSEPRGMFYHDGFFFEVFVEGSGKPIATGGSYGSLMAKYGNREPAVGFGVDVDALFEAFDFSGVSLDSERVDFLVIDTTSDKSKGIAIASTLRSRGYNVARDIIKRSVPESIEYAKDMGIRRVVVVSDELLIIGKVRVIDFEKKEELLVDENYVLFSYPAGGKE